MEVTKSTYKKKSKSKTTASTSDSSSWKLKALIKKNLLILRRNTVSTLCEIFFPILILILMVAIRKAFKIKLYKFEEQEKDLESFIQNKSMANVDLTNPDIINNENISLTWHGESILPALRICSMFNARFEERSMIGSIGLPEEIKQQIIMDSLIFFPHIFFYVNYSNFKEFESVKQMEEYVKSQDYGTAEKPLLCFAARFEDKGDSSYNYSLHYFDMIFDDGIRDLYDIRTGPIDLFQSGPKMESFEKYRDSGYTYVMKLINQYILRKETGNPNATLDFGINAMKYVDYRDDEFGTFVGYIIPFFVVIAYMCPLCLYVYRMVGEKESKAKEGMKIMGLTEGTYFLSYFLQFVVINLFDSIINAFLTRIIFPHIPYFFFLIIFILYSLNVFALAFFFQSFIDKTRVALILSLLIYFCMFFLSMACMNEDSSKSVKVGLSIFPPVCIEVGVILLGKFESFFRTYHAKYFPEIYTNYSLLIMYIMFIVDFFLYLFLGYYLQNVLPHEYGISRPWYFLFTSEYWCGKKTKNEENNVQQNINNTLSNDRDKSNAEFNNTSMSSSFFADPYKDDPNFEGEDLYKDKIRPDDALRVKNIVKTFDDGKTAVNHVNLNFYKDEIFALLGHNGAGKTTLISMLTGLYEATEGKAFYDGRNILEGNNMDQFRLKLGICPQHDILFEDLTIKEHLEMFSIFKGVDSNDIEEEVKKTMKDFRMDDIGEIVAKNLSAGQRRKLSIAISLIGGSKVIFLDEPSSGMDITSRRNLWEILKRQSEQKIIILTTHYMEEASVLGNRIGIINEGRMKCIGTPLFLIERYGKFMSLNVNKEEDADNDKIIEYINSRANNVEYEVLSEEIMFRIPKSNYSKNRNNNNEIESNNDNNRNKIDFNLGEFFNDLDDKKEELKIRSYSASMPTLEDVFLNVAAEDSKKLNKERKSFSHIDLDYDKILFETNFKEDFSTKSKFCIDFKASFHRRLLLSIRDLKGFLMEILCPILLVICGLGVSQVEFNWYSKPQHLDINYIGKQNVLYGKINGISNIEDYYFREDYENVTCQTLEFGTFDQSQKTEALQSFVDKVFETNKDTEGTKDKEIDMTAKDYTGYFGSLLMLQEEEQHYEFVEVLNARVTHGVPLYTHYFLREIIQKAAGHKVDIDFTHYPFPLTKEFQERSGNANNSIVVLFVAIAFSLIPANFITIIIKERINNSKHLMRISGINIVAYWIVNYIFELVKYYITGGICVLLIWIFDFYKKYLDVLYILYGPAMISMTYILSFLFESESNGQNGIILLNFLVGALCSTIVLMFRGLENVNSLGKALEYILALVPSFCFDFGYNLLLSKILIYVIDYKNQWMFFKEDELVKRFNLLLAPIIYLILELIIYTIILAIIESKAYSYSNPPDNRISTDINDSKVLKEIDRANNEGGMIKIGGGDEINENESENEYSVRVKNLKKNFSMSTGCCQKETIEAIKNLNFCVEPGECFGLLGLNGAGKTTTFKCITQEISPDNGSIKIKGKDMSNHFDELKDLFGYCPQYEAIFEYMTVYENLEFYAQIKGVKKELIDKIVNSMIAAMSLDEFTTKIAGKLSGGNKRKLSVAISMLCNPPIILLDEPSTGMDPEARRFMWSVIHKIINKGKKSSIIMTTHAMDEAETLCKRMAIMVNGEFVCLGKANEIKDKYGYGYEIDLRIKPLSENQKNELYQKLNNISNNFINGNNNNTNNDDNDNKNSLNLKTISNLNQLENEEKVKKINNIHSSINYNKKTKVTTENINEILTKLGKEKYISELSKERLGSKLIRDIEINGSIYLPSLLNWVFFVKNAIKFVKEAQQYFEEIILSEHIENNFLFKMKKGNESKSIGFLFGLFEGSKEDCFVTEYSIQQTSLEQIFNQFAKKQINEKDKNKKNKIEVADDEEEIKNEIPINDELYNKLLD